MFRLKKLGKVILTLLLLGLHITVNKRPKQSPGSEEKPRTEETN